MQIQSGYGLKTREECDKMERTAEYIRKTKETDIKINLNIDGTGKADIDTGIGFFDHMLDGFARHGFFDLDVKVEGDLAVDCHHTIEDTGIVLGNAIRKALKNKKGIKRFGSCILPMDETLVLCAVDLSGRPYLVFDGEFTVEGVYGYGNGKRIFLCRFLCGGYESAYPCTVRRQ